MASIVSTLGACSSVTPANPLRAELGADPGERTVLPNWPARDAEWAQAIAPTVRSQATVVRRTVVREEERLVPFVMSSPRTVLSRTVTDQGVLFEVDAGEPSSKLDIVRQPVGAMVFASRRTGDADVGGVVPSPKGGPEIAGIYLQLLAALNDQPSETKGIVVHLQGLAGVQYEQPVVDAVRRDGYVCIATEFPWANWKPVTIELGTEKDVFDAANALAEMSDQTLAEAAYAVEAAVEHLWRTRPELKDKPVVLMGFSAGSLALPTVAARLGERVRGAVLVGSGANIAHIIQTSQLTDGGVRLMAFGKRCEGAMAGLISGEYIRRSTLDPFHTAASMRRVPTLMLLGASDDIVPTTLGEELYHRLGEPEKWVFAGGHRRLFVQLDARAERIARWVAENVRSSTQAAADDAAKGTDKSKSSGGGNGAGRGGSLLSPK
ncbi:MAG: dienelactone hydrolase family protein [Phycisphaerales bacterium]|nr:dienelactone hydrolase family protein [Phycisphaerales bacterium]